MKTFRTRRSFRPVLDRLPSRVALSSGLEPCPLDPSLDPWEPPTLPPHVTPLDPTLDPIEFPAPGPDSIHTGDGDPAPPAPSPTAPVAGPLELPEPGPLSDLIGDAEADMTELATEVLRQVDLAA